MPRYTLIESARARHVKLRYSLQKGLEVTIPKGYDQTRIAAVLAQKRDWLDRAKARLEAHQWSLPPDHFESRPARIELRALARTYEVQYSRTGSRQLTLSPNAARLVVSGPVDDEALTLRLLNRWLRNQANHVLVPWLRRVSRELDLPFNKTAVRGQKTRWGSCSSAHNINLNYKLLFLPPGHVHYLFVHELCHTRHLDHSARYWRLVEQKLPDYRRFEKDIKRAWRYVPLWVGS